MKLYKQLIKKDFSADYVCFCRFEEKFVKMALKHIPNPNPLFSCKQIANKLFWIEENFFDSWNKANIFFVVGRDRDLLIDTGKNNILRCVYM